MNSEQSRQSTIFVWTFNDPIFGHVLSNMRGNFWQLSLEVWQCGMDNAIWPWEHAFLHSSGDSMLPIYMTAKAFKYCLTYVWGQFSMPQQVLKCISMPCLTHMSKKHFPTMCFKMGTFGAEQHHVWTEITCPSIEENEVLNRKEYGAVWQLCQHKTRYTQGCYLSTWEWRLIDNQV